MGSVASSGIRALLLCLAVTLGSLVSRAEAQIATQGAYQLSLEVNLVSRTHVDFAKDDARKGQNDLIVGVASPGMRGTLPGFFGVSGGYMLRDFLVLGAEASFGFARSTLSVEDTDQPVFGSDKTPLYKPNANIGTFMVRPQAELFATRKQHFAFGVIGGIDYRFLRSKIVDGATAIGTTHGVGPLGGVAAHFFITSAVSLDVRATGQLDWLRTSYEVSSYVTKSRESILAFTCGVSVWPHPK